MSKHQPKKDHSTNRVNTSVSISPETPSAVRQAEFAPSYEEIQNRAYRIHEEKGGSDFDNWLEAERILKQEHQMMKR